MVFPGEKISMENHGFTTQVAGVDSGLKTTRSQFLLKLSYGFDVLTDFI